MPRPASILYLDHLASTPLDPEVLEAMLPWLSAGGVGNPHSAHGAGWRATDAVEVARAEVAALVGARPGEVIFTSGATEANNLALLGAVPEGWPVFVSAVEHPSVLEVLPELARLSHRTERLPVDESGRVDPRHLAGRLADGPALLSVMAANNEVGTIQPVAELAALSRAHGALFHTDAAQALSTVALDMRGQGIDLLSLSGHKLYGPMGIGALVVCDGVNLRPRSFGGGQQEGRRAGTLPVALCVGLGAACRLAATRRAADTARLFRMRERLFAALSAAIPDLRRNSPPDGLASCLHVTLPGVDAADLLLDLPELAVSTGSACATGRHGPSHVLLAMGRSAEEAYGSLRFGLGHGTTEAELDQAVRRIAMAAARRRSDEAGTIHTP